MKLYEVTISPRAGFGTPLKGDTLFGHFCWQAAYDPSLLNGDLGDLIAAYPEKPFVIFSSAFPRLGNAAGRYYFKRPDLPLRRLTSLGGKDRKEKIKAEKAHNKKKWMEITGGPGLIDPLKVNFVTDKDLVKSAFSGMDVNARARAQRAGAREFSMVFSHPHNSINRLTQKTGAAPFTPYNQRVTHYYPDAELVIFILVDDSATDIQRVAKALERIGAWGFGRNASTGMGRFTVGKPGPIAFPKNPDANACYALAPSVAGKEAFEEIYFKTFVRYGKHGDRLARSGRPFKNPVIMADEGAVYIPREPSFFNKPYLGAAVTGVSKSMPETVVQGYAPYLPMKLEQRNETIPG
ncbi:MAG: hypothetical protein GY859_24010 [Desulfobacterales bacterium]|nr:hypothetical protein [Desulfobacterales bacterium]